ALHGRLELVPAILAHQVIENAQLVEAMNEAVNSIQNSPGNNREEVETLRILLDLGRNQNVIPLSDIINLNNELLNSINQRDDQIDPQVFIELNNRIAQEPQQARLLAQAAIAAAPGLGR